MGIVIAVANNKGGVGKSTTTLNLGHALALKGKKVLVIDLDSQCNLTELLGERNAITTNLYDFLEGNALPFDCIYPTSYERLDLLPNDEETSSLEINLIQEEKFSLLRDGMREYVTTNYDYTLLDCPPNLLYFVMAAMLASDFVIVPVLCSSDMSLKGLGTMLALIRDFQDANPGLRFLRLLVNGVDKRTIISRVLIKNLKKIHSDQAIFDTVIPHSTVFSQAEYARRSIIRHSPASVGARAHKALAEEIIGIVAGEDHG